MKISGIIWLDDIVDKLDWKHHVYQDEIRELLRNRPKFRRVEKGHQRGEDVYSAAGQTDSGRYLVAFFVYKLDRRALILSARDMSRRERKSYERK